MESSYEKAVDVLDSLLRRLLCTGWDERIRRQAAERAAWIATFGAAAAPRHARAVSRGLVALLSAPEELRPQLGPRLLDLLDRLKQKTGTMSEPS